MYLKALEINGFKSFAKKGHFDFTSQISGIVGPNGSGKSNVAEAFRFVLGEQSLKNMRSKKGTDLIFAGQGGQLNRAQVAVVFDNSKKMLDIDYNEVVIERVVLRDGTNEYSINGNKVRAKDVTELLAGANIGSTGHHIISQGEADKILMIHARDRKQVIEDALGLKVYTIKKNEAERKLAKALENLKEVKTEERSTAPRLSLLKREVEKIERARSLREELRVLYRQYFPQKKNIESELARMHDTAVRLQSELEEKNKEKGVLQEEMKNAASGAHNEKVEAEMKDLGLKIGMLRDEKNTIERSMGKLEVMIDMELQKKKQSEELPQADVSRLEQASRVIHGVWMNWAGTLLKEENISPERASRWQARMVDYDELPEASKSKDRVYAEALLAGLGEKQAQQTVFDSQLLEQYKRELEQHAHSLVETDTQINQLQPHLDALELEVGSPEIATQKIQINILEIEKYCAGIESSIRDTERTTQSLEASFARFESEAVHAQDLYGQESKSFFEGNTEGEVDLNLQEKIIRTRALLENAGSISSEDAVSEYAELQKRSEYIKSQVVDLEHTSKSLMDLVGQLDEQIEERFREGMDKINTSFNQFFKTLFSGGHAELSVVNVPVGKNNDEEMQEYELGVEMVVSLPNKKISSLSMLSGGERSLTSIALLFAMSQVAPPPFIILDETDAALDEANSKRYGDMVEELAVHSQLIVITHNRESMSRAGILYGVTMGDDGASRLLSVSLDEAEAVAK